MDKHRLAISYLREAHGQIKQVTDSLMTEDNTEYAFCALGYLGYKQGLSISALLLGNTSLGSIRRFYELTWDDIEHIMRWNDDEFLDFNQIADSLENRLLL